MIFKRLFICFILVFQAFSVHAEIVNWFTKEWNWSAETGIGFESDCEYSYDKTSADISVALNMKELQAFLGFNLQPSIFNVTASAVYAPTWFKTFNLGAKTIAHFQCYSDTYVETDFLPGFYFFVPFLRKFTVAAESMFLFKASKINAISDSVSWLKSRSMATAFYLSYRPIDSLLIKFDFSSYSTYQYRLFFCPVYRFGIEYKIFQMITVGSSAEFKYIDQFTLSSRFDGMDLRCFVRVEF